MTRGSLFVLPRPRPLPVPCGWRGELPSPRRKARSSPVGEDSEVGPVHKSGASMSSSPAMPTSVNRATSKLTVPAWPRPRPAPRLFHWCGAWVTPSPAAREAIGHGVRAKRAHIDDADGLDARPRRHGIDEMGRFAGLHAAPELLFHRDQDAEIEWTRVEVARNVVDHRSSRSDRP
jgi:hypothetical protein